MTLPSPQVAKLALGTVQFGMSYGISNQRGLVPHTEAVGILDCAYRAGIRVFDTAAQYGAAERIVADGLGKRPGLKIVTKTALLKDGLSAVHARLQRSAETFGAPIEAVLVHSAGDLRSSKGQKLWELLERIRSEGVAKRLGFSAYADDGCLELARKFRPEVVQIPLSILDQRLLTDGTLLELKSLGVEVHARSIFLQGLLLMPPDSIPQPLARFVGDLLRIRKQIHDAGANLLQAALTFVLGRPEVDHVVVGVTRLEELTELLTAASAPVPALDWASCALHDPKLLTPTLW